MATAAQMRANRANAKRSTGPKTQAGRRRVARNSRRHGLTSAEPNVEVTIKFFRAIVDNLNAAPIDVTGDDFLIASLNLAQCEAKLLEVRNAMTELDKRITLNIERIEKEGMIAEKNGARELLFKLLNLSAEDAKNPNHWVYHEIEIRGDMRDLEPFRLAMRERKILSRYRAEAEAKRRKAFKHWLQCRNDVDGGTEGFELVKN